MLPEINWKLIRNITFPIYKLNTDELHYYRGILYVNDLVIDDRNIKEDTLGKRRLHIKEKLYPLNNAGVDFLSLLQAKHRHFIDTKGLAFSYVKTMYCQVKSHKIEKITGRDYASTIKVKGITNEFILRRPPTVGLSWAGVVYIGQFPWEILEYTQEWKPSFKRKI
jgi:hypothetical protein